MEILGSFDNVICWNLFISSQLTCKELSLAALARINPNHVMVSHFVVIVPFRKSK